MRNSSSLENELEDDGHNTLSNAWWVLRLFLGVIGMTCVVALWELITAIWDDVSWFLSLHLRKS